MRSRVATRATAGLLAAVVLAGCAVGAMAGCAAGPGRAERTPSAGPTWHEYRPGLRAFPHLPPRAPAGATVPVVVLVPGGSWETADPSGLEPLAAALAGAGVVAVPVTVRAAVDGVVYPAPVEDVLCALADAAATARAAGITPGPLVLLGHSSGAHLAATAALGGERVTPGCAAPPVRPDALVGLAGPYDVRRAADAAEALFGVPLRSARARWDAGNPVLLAAAHPAMPVLLLHGGADDVVATSFTTSFAAALRRGGHPTTVEILPGAGHADLYAPAVAPRVSAWLAGLRERVPGG